MTFRTVSANVDKRATPCDTERTHVDVVFEGGILEVEDEMATELVVGAGVQVENVVCGALNSINLHQFVTNVLSMNDTSRCVDLMLSLTGDASSS